MNAWQSTVLGAGLGAGIAILYQIRQLLAAILAELRKRSP